MKKYLYRPLCLLFVLALVILPLAGCQDRKAQEQYRTDVAEIAAQIYDAEAALNGKVDVFSKTLSKENRQSLLAAVNKLSSAFASFAELEAPKRYKDVQKTLEDSAEAAGKGTDIYTVEFTTVNDETFNQAFVSRVAEGDNWLKKATQTVDAVLEELTAEGENKPFFLKK